MSQQGSSAKQRRLTPRRKPKGSTRVCCRKGSLGLGPNLAQALLDVSEGGARLLVGLALEPGQEVEVGLTAPGVAREMTRVGQVVWCVPTADGAHCIGVRFCKRLEHADLSSLSRLPNA